MERDYYCIDLIGSDPISDIDYYLVRYGVEIQLEAKSRWDKLKTGLKFSDTRDLIMAEKFFMHGFYCAQTYKDDKDKKE